MRALLDRDGPEMSGLVSGTSAGQSILGGGGGATLPSPPIYLALDNQGLEGWDGVGQAEVHRDWRDRAHITGGQAVGRARLEATGALRWSEAPAALLSAAAACALEEGEARQTIANGRRAGEGEPWVF